MNETQKIFELRMNIKAKPQKEKKIPQKGVGLTPLDFLTAKPSFSLYWKYSII